MPWTSLTPPSPPLEENTSTEVLRMTLRFYNGRVTVSVRPPYNNRRASVHLHWWTFGERHGCTKGPVPLSRIDLRMSTDEGFAAVLYGRFGKLHGSFEGSNLPWRGYGLGLPCNFLDAALTLPSLSLTLPWAHPWRSPNVRRKKKLTDTPRILYGDLTDTVIRP